MLAEFAVSFREVFEIALIVGIMLSCLKKSGQGGKARIVYFGVALAIVASVAAAFAFEALAGGFEQHEILFEGAVSVAAALLVCGLVAWMVSRGSLDLEIRQGVRKRLEGNQGLGLAAFSFLMVFREGVEIVLFLGGMALSSRALDLFGVALGAAAALLLAYAVLSSLLKLEMRRFFQITMAALCLLAAWLLIDGVAKLMRGL